MCLKERNYNGMVCLCCDTSFGAKKAYPEDEQTVDKSNDSACPWQAFSLQKCDRLIAPMFNDF